MRRLSWLDVETTTGGLKRGLFRKRALSSTSTKTYLQVQIVVRKICTASLTLGKFPLVLRPETLLGSGIFFSIILRIMFYDGIHSYLPTAVKYILIHHFSRNAG
jgi:hypothetical protein